MKKYIEVLAAVRGFYYDQSAGNQPKMNVWIVLTKKKTRTIKSHARRQMGKLLVIFPWKFQDLLNFC